MVMSLLPMSKTRSMIVCYLKFVFPTKVENLVQILQLQPGPVNATVTDEANSTLISIAGQGSIVRDSVRAERLWPTGASTFFHGPNDLSLRLLCFESQVVEYWNKPGGAFVRMLASAKAAITGEHRAEHGERTVLEIGAARL